MLAQHTLHHSQPMLHHVQSLAWLILARALTETGSKDQKYIMCEIRTGTWMAIHGGGAHACMWNHQAVPHCCALQLCLGFESSCNLIQSWQHFLRQCNCDNCGSLSHKPKCIVKTECNVSIAEFHVLDQLEWRHATGRTSVPNCSAAEVVQD